MVVDASVWVGLLVPRDVRHAACRAWIHTELARGSTLVIPAHAPVEVAGAISRRIGRASAGLQGVATMMATPGLLLVPIEESLARTAAEVAADRQLRGADALYVAVAYVLDLSLVTLVGELQQRAASYVRLVRP